MIPKVLRFHAVVVLVLVFQFIQIDFGHAMSTYVLNGQPGNVQIGPTNVINGLIVHQKGTITMFESCVRVQNCIVWFNNGCGHLR